MKIRKYSENDVPAMIRIWNEVVEEGVAFPQLELLDEESGRAFFAAQTYCGVADDNGTVVGLYILHPNNVGRCGHIANASYAVETGFCFLIKLCCIRRPPLCAAPEQLYLHCGA